jgi:toxic protein SymE
VSATNTHRPLTTTNSSKELTMAKANHKSRLLVTERFVTIREPQRYTERTSGNPKPATFYPWLKLAGKWMEEAGFAPHQRVRVAVEKGKLVITVE